MGDVIRFTSKSEIERARLIREARAIYDSIFPPNDAVSEQPDGGEYTFPSGQIRGKIMNVDLHIEHGANKPRRQIGGLRL
jgi:hypothetical protein